MTFWNSPDPAGADEFEPTEGADWFSRFLFWAAIWVLLGLFFLALLPKA